MSFFRKILADDGLLILTSSEYERSKKRGYTVTNNRRGKPAEGHDFEQYFKVGISNDYILMRRDFPIRNISPSDFSRLCLEMFRRNDEVLHNGEDR